MDRRWGRTDVGRRGRPSPRKGRSRTIQWSCRPCWRPPPRSRPFGRRVRPARSRTSWIHSSARNSASSNRASLADKVPNKVALLRKIPPVLPDLMLVKLCRRPEPGPTLRPSGNDPVLAELPQTIGDDSFVIRGSRIIIALDMFDSPHDNTGSVSVAPPPVDVTDIDPSSVVVAEKLIPESGRTLFWSLVEVGVRCRQLQPVLLVMAVVVIFNWP